MSASAAQVVSSMVLAVAKGMAPAYGSAPRTGLGGSSGCDPSPIPASPTTTVAPTRRWRLHWRRTTAPAADEPSAHLEALAAIQDSRLLVPVVAMLDELELPAGGEGLPREKSSDMAAVLMTGRDGRTALLAFTGTASLDRWAQSYAGGEARPVPVPARQAAAAALQDQAAALLVDVAGPVLFVIEDEDLRSLAAGHRLLRLDDGLGVGAARRLLTRVLDVQSGGGPCTLVPDRSPVPARAWMV